MNEAFQCEYSILHKYEEIPTFSYFTATWKRCYSWLKVRKSSRFTKCRFCKQITDALRQASRNGFSTHQIMRQKAAHIDFIERERREYRHKCELAELFPSAYLSMVVDRADQSKFSLPSFTSSMKDQRLQGVAVHLIGLLLHGTINKLSFLPWQTNMRRFPII